MKTVVILMLLVSCGKDPVKNQEAARTPVAIKAVEQGPVYCRNIQGCLDICTTERIKCETPCSGSYTPEGDKCRQSCQSKFSNCEWVSCENACTGKEHNLNPFFFSSGVCSSLGCSN